MNTIIWDMGGTLVDTYPEVDRALAHAVWGADPSAGQIHEVSMLRAESIAHAIDVLSERHRVDRGVLDGAYGALKRRWESHPAPLMDGAAEVMAAVRAAGGLNLVATHRDRTSARALLDALGLRLDDLVCAPDGYPRKPDPAMNLLLLRRHRLEPDGVLCVGDRPIDMQAAAAAGLAGALLVPPEEEAPEDPLPRRCSLIGSLRELLGRIG